MPKLFVATLVTEVAFVDDSVAGFIDGYREKLAELLTEAVEGFRLRTVRGQQLLHCAVQSVDRHEG